MNRILDNLLPQEISIVLSEEFRLENLVTQSVPYQIAMPLDKKTE